MNGNGATKGLTGFRVSAPWAVFTLAFVIACLGLIRQLYQDENRIGNLEESRQALAHATDTSPPTLGKLSLLERAVSNLEGQLIESRADRALIHDALNKNSEERVKLSSTQQQLADTIARIERASQIVETINERQVDVRARLGAIERALGFRRQEPSPDAGPH